MDSLRRLCTLWNLLKTDKVQIRDYGSRQGAAKNKVDNFYAHGCGPQTAKTPPLNQRVEMRAKATEDH